MHLLKKSPTGFSGAVLSLGETSGDDPSQFFIRAEALRRIVLGALVGLLVILAAGSDCDPTQESYLPDFTFLWDGSNGAEYNISADESGVASGTLDGTESFDGQDASPLSGTFNHRAVVFTVERSSEESVRFDGSFTDDDHIVMDTDTGEHVTLTRRRVSR